MTIYANHADSPHNWERFLSKNALSMKSSAIRELLKISTMPDVISFAGGLPAEELFPVRAIEEACSFILRNDGSHALQYSSTEGLPALREYIAESLNPYGLDFGPDNVLITSGSQQGLDFLGRIFVDPGTKVLTGNPTYLGAIQAWQAYQGEFATVPVDDDGMQVEMIEDVLAENGPVRFIYVLPNFQNPAGATLSLERRKLLVELARKHDLIIVEDDPYGALRYEGEDLTPIVAMAPERTIYLGTFSKTLTPGLRIGWVIAPQEIRDRFVKAKQGADLHTSTFDQMIANDIAQRGIIKAHVNVLRKTYGERRNTMLDAMTEFFPEGCSWIKPKGGLFLWASLPDVCNTITLLPTVVERKVAYVPGAHFFPHGDGGFNSMRLNFSNASQEQIIEGIRRLGDALKETINAC